MPEDDHRLGAFDSHITVNAHALKEKMPVTPSEEPRKSGMPGRYPQTGGSLGLQVNFDSRASSH